VLVRSEQIICAPSKNMHKNVSNYMCKKLCGSAGSARTKPAWIMSYVDGLKM